MAAGAQVEKAQVEQLDRLFLGRLRVVEGLDQVLARDRLVDLVERVHRLVCLGRRGLGLAGLQDLIHAEHVEDQHRVVGDHGTPGLGDDVGVRDALLVAAIEDRRDDVAGVLLVRIVHRRGKVRLRAVVVHAESAADVHVVEVRAEFDEPDVDPGRLPDRVLDRADRRDLRADVEVQQLEALEHPGLAQLLDPGDHLVGGEAELAAVTARLHPAPGALGGQLGADADVRPDAEFL